MNQPVTVQLHCRLTVTIDDPEAVTDLAVQQLREADIDWASEDDDLETAAAELKADLLNSLAGLAEPDRLLDGIPGARITVAGRPAAVLGPVSPRAWRRWDDLADIFEQATDPEWAEDRDLVDEGLDDPWTRQ